MNNYATRIKLPSNDEVDYPVKITKIDVYDGQEFTPGNKFVYELIDRNGKQRRAYINVAEGDPNIVYDIGVSIDETFNEPRIAFLLKPDQDMFFNIEFPSTESIKYPIRIEEINISVGDVISNSFGKIFALMDSDGTIFDIEIKLPNNERRKISHVLAKIGDTFLEPYGALICTGKSIAYKYTLDSNNKVKQRSIYKTHTAGFIAFLTCIFLFFVLPFNILISIYENEISVRYPFIGSSASFLILYIFIFILIPAICFELYLRITTECERYDIVYGFNNGIGVGFLVFFPTSIIFSLLFIFMHTNSEYRIEYDSAFNYFHYKYIGNMFGVSTDNIDRPILVLAEFVAGNLAPSPSPEMQEKFNDYLSEF